MKNNYQIIEINEKNLNQYPQVICFINPKNEFYQLKINWLLKSFLEGLKIKVLILGNEQKISGLIEYTPSEYAWRAIDGKGYLFIHCLWVDKNKNRQQGLGAALVQEVIKDAKIQQKNGVATIASTGAFMTKADLFLKNGFQIIAQKDDLQLLSKSFTNNEKLPTFKINDLSNYQGWHILYTKQCPWVARFIEELKIFIKQENLKITIKELTTAKEVQDHGSIYGTFNLIHNGKLLADRYISLTRFKNILKKVS